MNEVRADSAETRELLARVAAGDRRAINRLFTRHRHSMRRFIELRIDAKLRSRVDPSDVVQEAQVDAIGQLDDYLARRPMPFRVWLCRTARQRLIKIREQHVKAQRRAVEREVGLPDHSSQQLAQQLVALGPTPSQRIGRRELARQVCQAVAQLPEPDREILLMRAVEELSHAQISYILGITLTATKKRHGRAVLRLQQVLAECGLTEWN